MRYGLLLVSAMQGVGKGTLAEKILKPLVGENNVSAPNENQVVDQSFNDWIAHRRLVIIHEIYAGQSKKAYNKIKPLITDDSVYVNKKFFARMN